MNKIICINTFSGRSIYIETTKEKWHDLVEGCEVYGGFIVNGWHLNQDKIASILDQKHPEREDYKIVAIRPWREYHRDLGLSEYPDPPQPDYFISYSSVDKPEA